MSTDFLLRFPLVEGYEVPVDHGYRLYGAITSALPALHADGEWFPYPIRGLISEGLVHVEPHSTTLWVATTAALAGSLMQLACRKLVIWKAPKRYVTMFSYPEVRPFRPEQKLFSSFVTFNRSQEEEVFRDTLHRKGLDLLGPGPEYTLGRRRTLEVASSYVVGYEVTVSGLSDAQSVTLQRNGLGGRRRFGGGAFFPGKL